MKKIKIIALSATLVLIGSLFTYNSVFSKANETDAMSPPPLSLTVRVTQQPDICGVEYPCVCYVTIRRVSNDELLGYTLYSGPNTYNVNVADTITGYLKANVQQVANCGCSINTNPGYESGPPFSDFNVHVY